MLEKTEKEAGKSTYFESTKFENFQRSQALSISSQNIQHIDQISQQWRRKEIERDRKKEKIWTQSSSDTIWLDYLLNIWPLHNNENLPDSIPTKLTKVYSIFCQIS